MNNCKNCSKSFDPPKKNNKKKLCSKECHYQYFKNNFRHTIEAKRKISIASMGNKHSLGQKCSDEKKKRMSEIMKIKAPFKGKKLSVEHRKKLSESHKGQIHSEEWKIKMSKIMTGKKLPPRSGEYKNRQSLIKKKLYENGLKAWNTGMIGFMKGRKVSEEGRLNMSKAQKEKSHLSHFYIDGRCKERTNERSIASQSFEYKTWRRKVFQRDGYKCVLCDNTRNLNADHIKQWSLYPELRYEINNGRTLCVDCHKKTDNYGNKAFKIKKESLTLLEA